MWPRSPQRAPVSGPSEPFLSSGKGRGQRWHLFLTLKSQGAVEERVHGYPRRTSGRVVLSAGSSPVLFGIFAGVAKGGAGKALS